MKPTYLAAALAAAVTLTGMSTPAHAAFTIDESGYSPDAGTLKKIDEVWGKFNFDWAVDGSGGSVNGSFNVSFLAESIALDGFIIGFDPRGGDVSITQLELNDDVIPSASGGSGNVSTLTFANVSSDFVNAGSNTLTVTLEASPDAYGSARVSAVPLPAAAWLMIGGLGALGAYGRQARRTTAASA